MARPSTNTIVFNAAGAALFLFLGGYMINGFLTIKTMAPCSERYPTGLQFSLDNSKGRPLSPIELQGRAGFREWGLLDNAHVEMTAGQPFSSSLVVNLASTKNEDAVEQNGVGYTWPVAALKKAQSACLSYYVYLSKDVDLASPGRLPGLMAEGPPPNNGDAPAGFAVRMGWSSAGDVGVNLQSNKDVGDWFWSNRAMVWPKETWVRIDQEVQLDNANETGAVGLWIDGKLDIEAGGLTMRKDQPITLIGVAGDVGYSGGQGKAAEIKTSPFIVQWQ